MSATPRWRLSPRRKALLATVLLAMVAMLALRWMGVAGFNGTQPREMDWDEDGTATRAEILQGYTIVGVEETREGPRTCPGSNAGWCWRPARTTRTGASVPGPGASRRGRSVKRAQGQVDVVAPVALLEDARRHRQVVDDPRGDAALIVLPRHLGRGAGSAGDGDRFGADRAEHLPARPPVLDDDPVRSRSPGRWPSRRSRWSCAA